jgi:AraC family transcriptional regulator
MTIAMSPETWGRSLSAPPVLASDAAGWKSGVVRRWTDTCPDMSQPFLDHHYVVLHLGGPKHVEREGLDGQRSEDVAEGSITIVPAGTAFEWRTTGPIDFAHLYVRPSRLSRSVASVFDRDPASIALRDVIGVRDPLLEGLVRAMLAEAESTHPWRAAYLDALLDAAVVHLARNYSTLAETDCPSRYALAPARLRRVLDHIEMHIGSKLALAELAQTAGLSPFHFSRAFQSATGEPPMTYVARRRVAKARELLRGPETLAEIARLTGFVSPSYFAAAFRSHTGLCPSAYRRHL